MSLLASIISPRDLAALSEHQLDVLISALDSEILTNAAVKKAVTSKIQAVHKSISSETQGRTGGKTST